MGDVDEGDAQLVLKPLQFNPHPQAQEFVQRRKRFVQKQHLGVGDQRAGQRDALLLAARKLGRDPVGEVEKLNPVQHLTRLVAPLGGRHAVDPQAEGDVVGQRQMREQRVVLEHQRGATAAGPDRGHILTPDGDGAGCRRLMPRDHAQKRGLAAARRADHAAIGAAVDGQVDIVDRADRAVKLGDAANVDTALLGHADFPLARARLFWTMAMVMNAVAMTRKLTAEVTVPMA